MKIRIQLLAFLILLKEPTLAFEDKILKINDPAPFYGVLVSEPRYRTYQNAIEQLDVYKSKIEEKPNNSEDNMNWLFFAIGMGIGVSSTLLLSH